MSGKPMMRYALAIGVCLCLGALTALAPMVPCGYRDTASNVPAGYGHHSLAKVVSEGFGWDSSTVPTAFADYSGTGPYAVHAGVWIVILYVPIFAAIIFLGLAMVKHPVSTIKKSRRATK